MPNLGTPSVVGPRAFSYASVEHVSATRLVCFCRPSWFLAKVSDFGKGGCDFCQGGCNTHPPSVVGPSTRRLWPRGVRFLQRGVLILAKGCAILAKVGAIHTPCVALLLLCSRMPDIARCSQFPKQDVPKVKNWMFPKSKLDVP